MTQAEFVDVMNEIRFIEGISMTSIEKETGRSYQGIRSFFHGKQDTTIYLVFDILNGLGVNLMMDGHEVETHEDALKVIRKKFGDGEYLSTSKEFGMKPTALRSTILGGNSKLSTFLKVCDGLKIDLKVRKKQ